MKINIMVLKDNQIIQEVIKEQDNQRWLVEIIIETKIKEIDNKEMISKIEEIIEEVIEEDIEVIEVIGEELDKIEITIEIK